MFIGSVARGVPAAQPARRLDPGDGRTAIDAVRQHVGGDPRFSKPMRQGDALGR